MFDGRPGPVSPSSPLPARVWRWPCAQHGLRRHPPARTLQFAQEAAGPAPHLTQPLLIPCVGHMATHTSGKKKLGTRGGVGGQEVR